MIKHYLNYLPIGIIHYFEIINGMNEAQLLKLIWESDDFGYTWKRYEGMFHLKIYKYQKDNCVLPMATHTVAI